MFSEKPDHVVHVFDGGIDAVTEGNYLAFISRVTPVAFCEGGYTSKRAVKARRLR
mgnify:CR=1 FL=1